MNLTKFSRVFGLFLIILFGVASILIYKLQNEIQVSPLLGETWKSILKFPNLVEDRFYDIRIQYELDPKRISPNVVLGAIDDKSLQKFGRWPFSRTHWATITYKLQHFGAKVVAHDTIFPEPEKSYGNDNPDQNFANAIFETQSKGMSTIISYALTARDGSEKDSAFEELPPELFNFIMDATQTGSFGMFPRSISNNTFPIPTLLESGVNLAHIEGAEDIDGVFRRYPYLVNSGELYFPSLSLLAYQIYSGDTPKLIIDPYGSGVLKFQNGEIPLNYFSEAKLRWFGSDVNYTQFSLADLVEAPEDSQEWKDKINGKIVFIGSTAYAAHDIRNTPVDPTLPGVYFHMNATQMLLNGLFYKPEDRSLLFSWLILGVGSLLMIAISLAHNAIFDVIFIFSFIIGIIFLDLSYLTPQGYQITLFFSLLSVLGVYSWNTFLNFYISGQDKKFLKEAFGTYISPELIDQMYNSGAKPSLGGESGPRTAFFTDIQGFSTFSEKLTPTKLVELLNEYLSEMTDILLSEQGTLDKYEGDAIIAFFGAPMPLPDHAIRACRVANKMQLSLLELRKKWTSEGDKWPQIVHEMRMRIGLNTGEIVTGNMGSKMRMNYTMMGDAVNLAARLEESAKQYGIFTHVSQFTYQEAKDAFDFRELDTIKVVGKSEPVTTYELLGEKGQTPQLLLDLKSSFEKGLENYKKQNWDEALKEFKTALELEYQRFPELKGKKTNPSLIYIERCENFKLNPPGENWDGVYTLTEK